MPPGLSRRDFQLYNEIAKRYPETEVVYHTEQGRLRKEWLEKRLVLLKGRTLDIGCNDSHYAKCIKDYVGVDAARFKDNVQGVMQRLPFADGSFDNALMTEVLEHIYDRVRALREARRVVRKGGLLLVTVPYGTNPWKRVWFPVLEEYGVSKRKYVHGELPGKYLELLLRLAGFTRVRTYRPFWFQLVAFAS